MFNYKKDIKATDRNTLAEKYFSNPDGSYNKLYSEGNLAPVTLLSNVQYFIDCQVVNEVDRKYCNEIINDVKEILIKDHRKQMEGQLV